jgi:hypothetical protein
LIRAITCWAAAERPADGVLAGLVLAGLALGEAGLGDGVLGAGRGFAR